MTTVKWVGGVNAPDGHEIQLGDKAQEPEKSAPKAGSGRISPQCQRALCQHTNHTGPLHANRMTWCPWPECEYAWLGYCQTLCANMAALQTSSTPEPMLHASKCTSCTGRPEPGLTRNLRAIGQAIVYVIDWILPGMKAHGLALRSGSALRFLGSLPDKRRQKLENVFQRDLAV